MRRGFYLKCGKRLIDVAVSGIALVLLSPLLIAVALLARLKLGSPVLFRQKRPGLNGDPFVIFKFRTMTDQRDSQSRLLSDKERLTSFGRFLRSTSLDELPELFNVLIGDMSLVGPRPLLMRYQAYYFERERKRFQVRPGITGWAQVNGRNTLRWDDRLNFDVWYAENLSFTLDLRILGLTVLRTLRHHGVEVDPCSVMLDLDVERGHDAQTNRLRAD
jgi:lipopolysaccharide/colanic/teichoic acid biosynthesis glycosyltransferase